MRTLLAVVVLALAFPVFAQRSRERHGGKDVGRALDTYRYQKDNDLRYAENSLRSDRLKNAIRDFSMGEYDIPRLHATFGEFTTRSGQYFVALHLALPPTVSVPDDAKLTFFGVLEDSARKARWSVEEPGAVQRSKTGQYFERSLLLEPQIFNGVFGLAIDGNPIGMVMLPMDLRQITKDSRSVSRLLLATEVFVLDKPPQSLDPFSFGGVKIVPKADRTFNRKEEVWLFVESQNPRLAEDGKPRFTAKVEAIGQSPDGARLLRSDAATTALPLRGVPNHYGVGTTLDISRLTPGEWKLRVSVADVLADERYELLETIQVVE